MIRLVIDMPTPSLNRTLRAGWNRRRGWKRDWRLLLLNQINIQGLRPACWQKARIDITRTGARILDRDNLIGGCKCVVVDNLKDLGFYADDDPEHLYAEYHQRVGKPYQTEITLEEAA